MAPSRTVKSHKLTHPLLNAVNYPTIIKRDLPINQANYSWTWLPITESSLMEHYTKGAEMQWPTLPASSSSMGSEDQSSDSMECEPVIISSPILKSSGGSSRMPSNGDVLKTISTKRADVINASYICHHLGLNKSIFTHEESVSQPTKVERRSPSVPTCSFIYAHEHQKQATSDKETTSSTSMNPNLTMEGFETIDLTADGEGQWTMTQQTVLCEASSHGETTRVQSTDYQVVAFPSENPRKKKIVLIAVISSLVVVVVVIVTTVLMTYFLQR